MQWCCKVTISVESVDQWLVLISPLVGNSLGRLPRFSLLYVSHWGPQNRRALFAPPPFWASLNSFSRARTRWLWVLLWRFLLFLAAISSALLPVNILRSQSMNTSSRSGYQMRYLQPRNFWMVPVRPMDWSVFCRTEIFVWFYGSPLVSYAATFNWSYIRWVQKSGRLRG